MSNDKNVGVRILERKANRLEDSIFRQCKNVFVDLYVPQIGDYDYATGGEIKSIKDGMYTVDDNEEKFDLSEVDVHGDEDIPILYCIFDSVANNLIYQKRAELSEKGFALYQNTLTDTIYFGKAFDSDDMWETLYDVMELDW